MRAAIVMGLVLTAAASARAQVEESPRPGWRLAVGAVGGAVAFDEHLADYRWDTRPAAQAGMQATLYRGRFGAGARVWRAHTTQASGIPGETRVPRVNLTALEMLAHVRVAAVRGIELWGSAHGGLLHLGYDPDELSFDTGGGAGAVTVRYAPISEWDYGLGAELRRELGGQLALSLQAEWSAFALDTAHRSGAEIVESRERFHSWSLRMQVSWLLNLG